MQSAQATANTMNDFLKTVIAERKEDVRKASQQVPFSVLQREVATNASRRSLTDRLHQGAKTGETRIIAEVKKASPSVGLILDPYDPAPVVREYEKAGACAISVLTEPRYFLGNPDDLRAVRRAVKLPVLRKDFLCDPYQIYESAAMNADVILLIVAALDFMLLRDLYIIALAIGLEVIVEVHSLDELEMVLPLAKVIIGVNNRDLATLQTHLDTSREMAAYIPPDRLCISESGIRTREEIEELQSLGYKGFLVGESLLTSDHPALQLWTLLGYQPQHWPKRRPLIT